MNAEQIERVFGRGRLRMVTGEHVEVFREAVAPGERRRYTKRFLRTPDGDFGHWTEREWRILARLIGHGVTCVPEVVQFDRGAPGGARMVQTYDAGVTVDQWATMLPVARDGRVYRHVFEDCAHWWSLAHHCLLALNQIHELQLVHLDIKADNVCIPLGPPSFTPDADHLALHPMFGQLALIDFAFSLVSREPLTTALPIGWQKDYDYQSPRLLDALEAGRNGDLQPTRELDWRCDMYSLAAMLERYLPADRRVQERGEAGWTAERYQSAKALMRAMRESHDCEEPRERPHQDLLDITAWRLRERELAASLEIGWTLARDVSFGPADSAPLTPVTRMAPPWRVPEDHGSRPIRAPAAREAPARESRTRAPRRSAWSALLLVAASAAVGGIAGLHLINEAVRPAVDAARTVAHAMRALVATPEAREARTPGIGDDRTPGIGDDRTPGIGDDRTPGIGDERKPGIADEREGGAGQPAPEHRTGDAPASRTVPESVEPRPADASGDSVLGEASTPGGLAAAVAPTAGQAARPAEPRHESTPGDPATPIQATGPAGEEPAGFGRPRGVDQSRGALLPAHAVSSAHPAKPGVAPASRSGSPRQLREQKKTLAGPHRLPSASQRRTLRESSPPSVRSARGQAAVAATAPRSESAIASAARTRSTVAQASEPKRVPGLRQRTGQDRRVASPARPDRSRIAATPSVSQSGERIVAASPAERTLAHERASVERLAMAAPPGTGVEKRPVEPGGSSLVQPARAETAAIATGGDLRGVRASDAGASEAASRANEAANVRTATVRSETTPVDQTVRPADSPRVESPARAGDAARPEPTVPATVAGAKVAQPKPARRPDSDPLGGFLSRLFDFTSRGRPAPTEERRVSPSVEQPRSAGSPGPASENTTAQSSRRVAREGEAHASAPQGREGHPPAGAVPSAPSVHLAAVDPPQDRGPTSKGFVASPSGPPVVDEPRTMRPPVQAQVAPQASPPPLVVPAPPARPFAAADDDLASRAKLALAQAVPKTASRARSHLYRVLTIAANAHDASQEQGVIDAAQQVTDDESPLATSPTAWSDARRLNEDARRAYWSRNVDDAFSLQFRAFGANPRDSEIAGTLAFLYLRLDPPRPEMARQLAIHAMAVNGPSRPPRSEDWLTFAVASALTGRQSDARNGLHVAAAVSRNLDRTCRAVLSALATHGERVRAPVEAMLARIHSQGRGYDAPNCARRSIRVAGYRF